MPVAVETGLWELDPARSTVAFRHKSMWGLVTVNGRFTVISGGGEVLPDGTAHGTLVLDASSLDTRQGTRDKHLRSAAFFHAQEHPEITFTARNATPQADGTVQVTGELTVRGTTRPLSFTAHADTAAPGAVSLSAQMTVDRAEFGLTWNQLGSLRGLTTVTVNLRFTHKSA